MWIDKIKYNVLYRNFTSVTVIDTHEMWNDEIKYDVLYRNFTTVAVIDFHDMWSDGSKTWRCKSSFDYNANDW